MSIRIHQLAIQLGLDNKEMMALLKERKIIAPDVKSVSSTVDNISASALRDEFAAKKPSPAPTPAPAISRPAPAPMAKAPAATPPVPPRVSAPPSMMAPKAPPLPGAMPASAPAPAPSAPLITIQGDVKILHLKPPIVVRD